MNEDIKPAGFWLRLAANSIDGFLLYFLSCLFMQVSTLRYGSDALILLSLLDIAFYMIFLSSRWQATPGKRLIGVYIVNARDYKPIGKLRAFCRYILFNPFFILITIYCINSTPTVAQQERLMVIDSKIKDKQTLTEEEKQFHGRILFNNIGFNFSEEESECFFALAEKNKKGEEVNPKDCQSAARKIMSVFIMWGLSFIYALISALTIAFTKQKRGLHDRICHTLALRGRPEKPIFIHA
jgi:uncharacterized RDD family membrane protein YckC